VGQDALSGPDSGSFEAIEAGAIPSVSAFEAADPAFAAGSSLHRLAGRRPVFDVLPGFARFTFAGDHHVAYPEVVEVILDAFLAVATVGGDGTGRAPGAADDPFDGRGQLRRVGRVALLNSVVEHDPVLVVEDLGFGAELHRLTEAALGDRAGVRVVQAHPPARPIRGDPGDALAGLRGDLASSPVIRRTVAWASSRPAAVRSRSFAAIACARLPADRLRSRNRVRVAPPAAWIRRPVAAIRRITLASKPESVG
jgi:hypothetical protein